MADRLNLRKPYVELDGPKGQADYVWQDGQIFSWSESNVQYEPAWWLKPDGTLIDRQPPIVLSIDKTRPFDPAWLEKVKVNG